MTKKTKRNDAGDADKKADNASSPAQPGAARPWTEEEMAAAKPLPVPTVDAAEAPRTAGLPYVGRGKTKPAGQPEDEENRR